MSLLRKYFRRRDYRKSEAIWY